MRIGFKSLLAAGGVFVLALSAWGQKPKSKKEIDALNAINTATNVDDRLKAIDNVLTTFKDTEFRPTLLAMALQLEQQKGDYAQIMTYGQLILDKDPKNPLALVTMAAETARRTREFDLDKDDKLAKADKWAKDGIEYAKTAPKPAANMTDEQWESNKKDMQSQGYEALGMSAAVRKKYDEAVEDFKQSLAVSPNPEPATLLRLGQVYEDAGKLDDANDAFDKAAAAPNATPQIKSIAASKKAEVAKLKAGGTKPPAANAAAPASPAVPAAPQH
ncbi:MAG TPA: tetratricopeptide repeat protein [Bryobacteraceae bacterium]|nr:tetratricopeptide repeat protein [Bryobacteraceae bacterium]